MEIHIVPSYSCNLACDHCYATPYKNQYAGTMTLEQCTAILELLIPHNLCSVTFRGGEPTLWPCLGEAISHARNSGLICRLFTNGELISAAADGVIINMTRFMHAPLSRRINDNIDWYAEQGSQLTFQLNIRQDDQETHLPQLINLAGRFGAELRISVLETSPRNLNYGQKLSSWCERFINELPRVYLSKPLPRCMLTDDQYDFLKSRCDLKGVCDFDSAVPIINPDGRTVFPCSSLPISLPFGYILSKHTDFPLIKALSPCQSHLVPEECRSCQYYLHEQCHAGCLGKRLDPKDVPQREVDCSQAQLTATDTITDSDEVDWQKVVSFVQRSTISSSVVEAGHVSVGYTCDNNCKFCAVASQKCHGDRDTDQVLAEVKAILESDGVDTIIYSGGEPTLRADLATIVENVRMTGVANQIIQTNGRRLEDAAYLERLVNAGINEFFVSLHGPNSMIHDALTGANSAFFQTNAGLSNLQNLAVVFSTNTVICRDNVDTLSEIVTYITTNFPSALKTKMSFPNIEGAAADNALEVIVPVWEASPKIIAAIETGNLQGLYVDTEYFPMCLLGEYSERASELVDQLINVSHIKVKVRNWSKRLQALHNVFYAPCEVCDVREFCCGIHPIHHELFGENDCFKPISFWVRPWTDNSDSCLHTKDILLQI